MPRLTADLIAKSPQFFNALKERELDVRGHRIAQIESLGAAQDGFDTIDFSDNELQKLENFPLMTRLKTLIACNNKISHIGTSVAKSVVNLYSLVLTNNSVSTFAEIQNLQGCVHLERLSLINNPVSLIQNYRLYCIHVLPSLRFLDFVRIRDEERKRAIEVFGKQKKSSKRAARANAPIVQKKAKSGLTAEQKEKILAAIAAAETLEDVQRYENALRVEEFPSDLL